MENDNWPLDENTFPYRVLKEVLDSVLFNAKGDFPSEIEEFEEKLQEFLGVNYCVMTNSGSSANLLMIAALVETGKLKRGDKVLVPSMGASTTYFPLEQYGLIPVFVDVGLDGLIDIDPLVFRHHPEIRAILAVNCMGKTINPSDYDRYRDCILLEDNRDAFGSKYQGHSSYSGTKAFISTNSFHYSHQLNALQGGCVVTNSKEIYDVLKSLRDGGNVQNQDQDSTLYKTSGNSFEDCSTFVTKGYDVQAQNLNGGIGIKSLKKHADHFAVRHKNAKYFFNVVSRIEGLSCPQWITEPTYNTFGLPVFVDYVGDRNYLVDELARRGIMSCPIAGGNFLNQPVMRKIHHETFGTFENTEYFDKHGLMLANYDENLMNQIDKFEKIAEAVVDFDA